MRETVHRQDYSELVRDMRLQLGLSQEDFARELGVSYATVNRWENGQVCPSRLAKARIRAFCEQKVKQGSLEFSKVGARQRPNVAPRDARTSKK